MDGRKKILVDWMPADCTNEQSNDGGGRDGQKISAIAWRM